MSVTRHLIIDGYNVTHSLPKLQQWMQRGELEIARDNLFDMVKTIHDHFGYRVTLIFDGQREAIEVERPTKEKDFFGDLCPRQFIGGWHD